MTEEAEAVREELLPTPCRSRLAPTIPWWWEEAGRRHQGRHGKPTDPLGAIPSLARLRQLVERGDITVMRESRQSPQEAREEERGLMAEDPGMEHPDRGIGGDINLQTVPVEVEAGLEK